MNSHDKLWLTLIGAGSIPLLQGLYLIGVKQAFHLSEYVFINAALIGIALVLWKNGGGQQ